MDFLTAEVDRGDEGLFTWAYFHKCDMKWSNGRQINKSVSDLKPFEDQLPKSAEDMIAQFKRHEFRKQAFRFFSYYKMGYTVEWGY
ncbi:MAG: hypothetical protein HRT64_12375 [Erythrobacter sp.]|nr:hypothetical protein [Erythrobacter sp.]